MQFHVTMFFIKMGFLFLSFVSCDVLNPCSFNVNMKQMLLNEGFHRNITYGLVFSGWDERSQWLYEGCTVGLDQPLPPGLFVNDDELMELKRSQRLSASPKNRMNIELPAEYSTESNVYIVANIIDDKAYLWLPVHARYQAAKKGGGTARNNIPSPKLYLKCPDERLSVCDQFDSFQCNGREQDRCKWTEVPYTLLSEPLEWDVPVGNTDRYYLVTTGTISVVVFGAIYLLHGLHQFSVNQQKDDDDDDKPKKDGDDNNDDDENKKDHGDDDDLTDHHCCHKKDDDVYSAENQHDDDNLYSADNEDGDDVYNTDEDGDDHSSPEDSDDDIDPSVSDQENGGFGT